MSRAGEGSRAADAVVLIKPTLTSPPHRAWNKEKSRKRNVRKWKVTGNNSDKKQGDKRDQKKTKEEKCNKAALLYSVNTNYPNSFKFCVS